MTRRLTRLSLVLAVAAASVAGSVTPASAAFSNTPDPTWMTNGIVYAVTQSGDTVYVGGKFRALRKCPTGVTCPNGTIKTINVGAFDATTGEGIRTFKVNVGGDGATVYALAVLDGKLYIGGEFTSVNGEPRLNMAAVDAATGALDPFAPQIGVDTTDYVRGMIATQGASISPAPSRPSTVSRARSWRRSRPTAPSTRAGGRRYRPASPAPSSRRATGVS